MRAESGRTGHAGPTWDPGNAMAEAGHQSCRPPEHVSAAMYGAHVIVGAVCTCVYGKPKQLSVQ